MTSGGCGSGSEGAGCDASTLMITSGVVLSDANWPKGRTRC